jgi:transposase-like protein
MMRDEKAKEIEEEHGLPPGRLMYKLYIEEGKSAGEISNQLGEPRSTVKYWLKQAGIKMRSNTLSDVQRIMIIAYLSAGMGRGATAQRVGCGTMTVARYRKELESTQEPVDFNSLLSADDHELLCDVIADAIDRHTLEDRSTPAPEEVQ